MVVVCGAHGEMRNRYNIFVREPELKRLLERSSGRWEANIKMYLRYSGRMMWIGLV
jgi:hypothetical protein